MEFGQYLSLLRRWWWLAVASTALAAGVSYWASMRLPRVYGATTTLLVGQAIQAANPRPEDFATSERLAQTYAQLVRRQPLLQAAASALGLDVPWQSVARQVSARVVPGSQLLQVTVTGADPEMARLVADEVSRQLILHSPTTLDREQQERREFAAQQAYALEARIRETEKELSALDERLAWETSARSVLEIQNQVAAAQQKIAGWQATYATLTESLSGSRTNNLSIVEPAVASLKPISPDVPRNVGVAAGIGLLFSLGGVLVLEYLDDTLKTSQDVDRLLKLACLGTISRRRTRSGAVAVAADPDSPLAEEYRLLRTSLFFTGANTPGASLLVTSAVPGEGKTTTACNVAAAFAQSGKRVVLCDADLRRPSVDKFYGVTSEAGLGTLLADSAAAVGEMLIEGPIPGLKILPAGFPPPNPADLLSSPALPQRLAQLREHADIIVVDSPALLSVADPLIIGAHCDGALLVADARRTHSRLVRRAGETLAQIGIQVQGVVLNNAREQLTAFAGYYAGSYHTRRADESAPGIWRRIRTGARKIWGRRAVGRVGMGRASATVNPEGAALSRAG